MRRLLVFLFVLAAALAALGLATAQAAPRIVRYSASIAGLARPLRLVQISDSHGGALVMPPARLARIVAAANAEHPDLVVLTGDYINGYPRAWTAAETRAVLQPFGFLRAPLGVVAVFGNHDDPAVTRAGLAGTGIRLLAGETVDLGPLRVLGIDDLLSPRDPIRGMRRAAQGLAAGAPVIAIGHEPEYFQWLPPRVQLLIAGHTHGGQIVFPVIGTLHYDDFIDAHLRGRFVEHGQTLIVSSGLGTSLLPFRIGVPPEIVVISLVPAPAHSVGRNSGTDK